MLAERVSEEWSRDWGSRGSRLLTGKDGQFVRHCFRSCCSVNCCTVSWQKRTGWCALLLQWAKHTAHYCAVHNSTIVQMKKCTLLGCHNSRGVHQTWLDPEFYPQSVSVSVTTEQVSVNMWCVVSRPGAKSWVVFLSYHSLLQPVSIFFSYLAPLLCFDPTHSSTFVLAKHFTTLFLAWKYIFSKL